VKWIIAFELIGIILCSSVYNILLIFGSVNAISTDFRKFVILYKEVVLELAIFTNILRIMENKKVTQKQMADYIGVTEQKISDWKAGRLKSYTKHLNKMAECLGVSVDELLGNKNNPPS